MNLTQEQITERISVLVGGADKKINVLSIELKDTVEQIKAKSKLELKEAIAQARSLTKERKKEVKSKCKIAVAKWTKLLQTLDADRDFRNELDAEKIQETPENCITDSQVVQPTQVI